jgi:hypothetical protein
MVKNLFTVDDMERIKGFITYKSWWDSVDDLNVFKQRIIDVMEYDSNYYGRFPF